MTQEKVSMWMQGASAIVIGFGGLIALGAHPALDGFLVFLADVLIWPYDGVQTGEASEFRLLSAIGGGVMVGWGLMLWILSGRGMREAPEMSKTIILISIWSWFIVDTAGSIIAQAYLNGLGNAVFLAAFVLPLRALKT